jgi:hypothetical protein
VAVLLPTPPHQPPIALGIGAALPKLREQKDSYLAALRHAVELHGRHVTSGQPPAAVARRAAAR